MKFIIKIFAVVFLLGVHSLSANTSLVNYLSSMKYVDLTKADSIHDEQYKQKVKSIIEKIYDREIKYISEMAESKFNMEYVGFIKNSYDDNQNKYEMRKALQIAATDSDLNRELFKKFYDSKIRFARFDINTRIKDIERKSENTAFTLK